MMSESTWLVVGGEGRARIFAVGEAEGSPGLQKIDDISNEHGSATRLTEKQAGAYSESERNEKERDKFAFQVAKYIEAAHAHKRFEGVKLIAESKFLGMILVHLNDQTKASVIERVSKDYSGLSTGELQAVLEKNGRA
jgi:protein required for attachment to host cells